MFFAKFCDKVHEISIKSSKLPLFIIKKKAINKNKEKKIKLMGKILLTPQTNQFLAVSNHL